MLYRVQYDDGDAEEYSLKEAQQLARFHRQPALLDDVEALDKDRYVCDGARCGCKKLRKGLARRILAIDKKGVIIREYCSISMAARKLSMARVIISDVVQAKKRSPFDFTLTYADSIHEFEEDESGDDDDSEFIPYYCDGKKCSCRTAASKRVQRLDDDGAVVEEYLSLIHI